MQNLDLKIRNTLLSEKITLQTIELMEVAVPQIEPFRSAIGIRNERQALFVRWIDADRNWGIGECSCRPDPFYNCEFVNGAIAVIRDYVFPALNTTNSIGDVLSALSRVRGWNFTASAVLDAVFDLRRRMGKPDPLDLWQGEKITRIPAGISLGIFDTESAAVERVQAAIENGYHRVKLKIKPGMDLAPLAAIRESFPDVYIGFDANGSCGESDWAFLKAVADFRPAMLEQPFDPHRIDLCRELKNRLPQLRICLDESITNIGDLISAHQLNALDEVNIKPGRVGGIVETLKIRQYCFENELPCWVGGMFETGIGRLANLRVAAGIPGAKAHDLSPSNRYFKLDVVKQPITMDSQGFISLENDRPVALDDANIRKCLKNKIILTKDKG